MAKLDRLVWADGISFTAYGVRVGVRVNHREILEALVARLPPGSKPSNVRTVNHLYSSLTGPRAADDFAVFARDFHGVETVNGQMLKWSNRLAFGSTWGSAV